MQAGCRRWRCPACGRRNARKVAARFSRLGADVLMTLSLPRSAWATPENAAELQKRCRSLLRYMVRHRLVEAYGWVREEGKPRAECVCAPMLQGCICGANGRQLHRHFLLRVPRRNGFRRGWLPWKKLQAAAKRCGLGTLAFQPVRDGAGAARYVSKYLAKSVGAAAGRARRYAMNISIPESKEPGWVRSRWSLVLFSFDRLPQPRPMAAGASPYKPAIFTGVPESATAAPRFSRPYLNFEREPSGEVEHRICNPVVSCNLLHCLRYFYGGRTLGVSRDERGERASSATKEYTKNRGRCCVENVVVLGRLENPDAASPRASGKYAA